MLEKVKLALRISTDAFNDELNDLIGAALPTMSRRHSSAWRPDTRIGVIEWTGLMSSP